jgi:hypothetical protein
MKKVTNLREFLGRFIKQKPWKEDKTLKEAYKKKREEISKKFQDKNQGKDDHFDRDDFIY